MSAAVRRGCFLDCDQKKASYSDVHSNVDPAGVEGAGGDLADTCFSPVFLVGAAGTTGSFRPASPKPIPRRNVRRPHAVAANAKDDRRCLDIMSLSYFDQFETVAKIWLGVC